MKRRDSQQLRDRWSQAIENGTARECIGKKCVCWWFCSQSGKRSVPVCDCDLSTGFYHKIAEEETREVSLGNDYRDPFLKKKKKKRGKEKPLSEVLSPTLSETLSPTLPETLSPTLPPYGEGDW